MTNIQEEYTETKACTQDNPPHENRQLPDPIMSDEGRRVLEIIFCVVIIGIISVVGSLANIINIVIFVKQGLVASCMIYGSDINALKQEYLMYFRAYRLQGFSDSVNISLCGLAVSDLGSLLPLTWMSICYNPLFQYSDIEFDSIQVQYLSAGWSHGCFAWITSWITAFITFERCVCIALPMKVKTIITQKRTSITVIVIFLVMFTIVSPVFFCTYFAPSFQIERNKTLVGLAYTSNGLEVSSISHYLTIAVQFISVIIVVVCTVILIQHLVARSRWLLKSKLTSSTGTSNGTPSRDVRVMTMVTFISCIFLACFIPSTVTIILMVSPYSEFSYNGRYRNTFQVTWVIVNAIEAVSSSVNIIVYYNMSTKFRATFNDLFAIGSVNCLCQRHVKHRRY